MWQLVLPPSAYNATWPKRTLGEGFGLRLCDATMMLTGRAEAQYIAFMRPPCALLAYRLPHQDSLSDLVTVGFRAESDLTVLSPAGAPGN